MSKTHKKGLTKYLPGTDSKSLPNPSGKDGSLQHKSKTVNFKFFKVKDKKAPDSNNNPEDLNEHSMALVVSKGTTPKKTIYTSGKTCTFNPEENPVNLNKFVNSTLADALNGSLSFFDQQSPSQFGGVSHSAPNVPTVFSTSTYSSSSLASPATVPTNRTGPIVTEVTEESNEESTKAVLGEGSNIDNSSAEESS